MEDVQQLIEKVVSESGKEAESVKKMMEERKERTHGLLSDYGAVYAVAKELGVELSDEETKVIPLSDIQAQSSVNAIGAAKEVYSVKEFTRKDGSTGRLASINLIDQSGEKRLVLWDNNSSIVSKVKVGDTILVRNAMAKENRGQIEIHAGSLTNVSVNPSNVTFDLPKIETKFEELSGLGDSQGSVNIKVRVNAYYPKTEFDRKDGSKGSRASFVAQDKTGTKRVVLWDDMAATQISEGDIVEITNAYTRKGLSEDIEVHVGSRSALTVTGEDLGLEPLKERTSEKLTIEKITGDSKGFSVEARILKHYGMREYSKGTMASMVLGDSSGTIRAVFWNETSPMVEGSKEGDSIRLVNVYAKDNMNGEPEIHVGRYSKVESDSNIEVPSTEKINDGLATVKKIADLDSNDSFIKISGKIMDFEDRPIFYMTCDECNKKVQNMGGEWMCEECGVVEGQANMVVSAVVQDDTGIIKAVAFKQEAEKLVGFDQDAAMNMIGESADEKAPLTKAKADMVGKDVSVIGRVNYNDFSDQLEFMVSEVV